MKDLPTRRTMFGFAFVIMALAPIIAIGWFIEPANEVVHKENLLTMFKWVGAFGMVGLGLLASACDKYEKLIAGENNG